MPGARRIWLAGIAAAVVAVAGIAVYVGRDGPDSDDTSPGSPIPTATESSTPDPAIDAARVREENRRSRRAAVREAERALASMPVPEGARPVRASGVPPLANRNTSLDGSNKSVTRTGFWLVPADPQELADWYTLHLPKGMVTGPHDVGGSRNSDGSWSEDVIYDGRASGPASHSSALVQVTPVGTRSGVRITLFTFWRPARPLVSFVPDDVTAIRVVAIQHRHRRVIIVRAQAAVRRIVRTYDALPGTHGFIYSCPLSNDWTKYRITFVSQTRRLSAWSKDDCWTPWRLTADGAPIEPALEDDDDRLLDLVARVAK